MNQRIERKAESRRAILGSAAELLRERGPSGTSVQEAMAGAGLTVGAFYAHFRDKDDLLAEAFTQALEDTQALVDEAADGKSGAAALTAVVDRYLGEEHRDDVRRGCPLPATLGEAAVSRSAPLHRLVATGVESMQKRLAAVAPGEIGGETALALLALMAGGQIVARAVRGTRASSRVLAACRRAGADLVGLRAGEAR